MKVKFYPTRNCWRLVVPARFEQEGKDHSYYFKSKEEGQKKINQILARGTSAKPQLDDAKLGVLALAEQRGLSPNQILAAIELYQKTVLNLQHQAHLYELIEKFLQRQEHEGRRPRTLDDDRQRFGKLALAFGNIDVMLLTEVGLRQYLEQYPPGSNRRSHYKSVRKFIRWAHLNGYLAIDLMARIRPLDKWGVNNDTVPIEDFRRLLFVCAGLKPINPDEGPTTRYLSLLAYFVLGGLCGMRRAEMLRDRKSQQILVWEDINWARDLIIVPHEVAKQTRATDRRRYIPLEPAAREWLQLIARPTGSVVDIYQSTHTKLCRELFKALDLELPENGLRNSYASYAQTFRSPGDVAKACGDLESTVRRFYTQVLAPDDGRAWFDIRPGGERKIVPMQEVA